MAKLKILPTVTIHHPTAGRMVINASDFDPTRHVVWTGEDAAPEPPAPPSVGPDPVYRLEQKGPWWQIMDRAGEKVGKSHRSEPEARQALAELIAAPVDQLDAAEG